MPCFRRPPAVPAAAVLRLTLSLFGLALLMALFCPSHAAETSPPLCNPVTCPSPGCFRDPVLYVLTVAEVLRPDPTPPDWVDLCPPDPSPPCIVPENPTIDARFPVGAQELTMRARIPAAICPKGVYWTVEYQPDPSEPDTWLPLYTHFSEDSVIFGAWDGSDKYAVFGASGLVPGKLHRFSVAHSCDAMTFPEVPTMTCVSECPSGSPLPPCSARQATVSFQAGASYPAIPALPAPRSFHQEVEDTFSRPETRPKRSQTSPSERIGDGLGPDEVWHDDWDATAPLLTGAHTSEGGSALLPPSSLVEHQATAQNEHSFVEIEIATDAATTGYNIDLRGRRFSSGSAIHFYFLKLARNLQQAGSEPDLILNATGCPETRPSSWTCKTDGASGFSWVEMARWNLGSAGNSAGGAKCTAMPPLGESADHKVWLRLEVEDNQDGEPIVSGGIGWMDDGSECPAGPTDLTACDRWCTFQVVDTSSQSGTFKRMKGQWGIWSHERTYRLHVFRAGSAPGS